MSFKRYDTILVDGYNAIHNWQYFRKYSSQQLKEQRQRLIKLLENFSSLTGIRVIIVFDGKKEEVHTSGCANLKILFSPNGLTADSVIEQHLCNRRSKKKTLVVTSDRDLSSVCVMRGAITIRSEAFEVDLLSLLEEHWLKQEKSSGTTFEFGDRVKRDALLSLLETLKDERSRFEQQKLLDEMQRLRKERQIKRQEDETETERLRRGLTEEEFQKEDDEGYREFQRLYGNHRIDGRKNTPEEDSIIVEDEDFDWVAAMEDTLKDPPKKY
jgi:predicted RNA-binding protein with PIN domain